MLQSEDAQPVSQGGGRWFFGGSGSLNNKACIMLTVALYAGSVT